MTKKDILRIDNFIAEFSKQNIALKTALSVEKPERNHLQQVATSIHILTMQVEGFLRACLGESSSYINDINQLNESEVLNIDKIELMHSWDGCNSKIISTLEKAKYEISEKVRIENQKNSFSTFLNSSQTKGIVLTTLLSILVLFFSRDYIYNLFKGLRWKDLGGKFANFEVVEQVKTVDLTEWTPSVDPNSDELTGKSIYNDDFILRKIRNEGNEFCITAGSSGSEAKFTSGTHEITQTPIDMKLDGWPNFKKQTLAILNVSNEKIDMNFKANIRSVRYRGFADDKANWCSTGIWHPTRKIVYHVKFPKGKMGYNFSVKTSFFNDKNNWIPLNLDNNFKIDSTSINWTIEHPIIGNSYRIDWLW